jgi:hypothetical protein
MVKHEIKVELKNSIQLTNLIEKSYFLEGDSGKILKKDHFITISPENDIDYSIFKGMDGATVKVLNEDVIDGSMRFMVEESNTEIRLYPISIYAIKQGNIYSFY